MKKSTRIIGAVLAIIAACGITFGLTKIHYDNKLEELENEYRGERIEWMATYLRDNS